MILPQEPDIPLYIKKFIDPYFVLYYDEESKNQQDIPKYKSGEIKIVLKTLGKIYINLFKSALQGRDNVFRQKVTSFEK